MDEDSEEEQERYRSPLVYIGALFLILIVVAMAIPYYGVRLDPEPSSVPTKEEVVAPYAPGSSEQLTTAMTDYRDLVKPADPVIKQTADRIAALSCKDSKLCQAKAIYYFVRDNYRYVADPINTEYLEDPKEFLSVGGGDCESGTLMLASLLEAIGVDSQLVFIPRHAFLRIDLNAPRRYQREGWIYLDWTCKHCAFGEIPLQNIGQEARYLEVP